MKSSDKTVASIQYFIDYGGRGVCPAHVSGYDNYNAVAYLNKEIYKLTEEPWHTIPKFKQFIDIFRTEEDGTLQEFITGIKHWIYE